MNLKTNLKNFKANKPSLIFLDILRAQKNTQKVLVKEFFKTLKFIIFNFFIYKE